MSIALDIKGILNETGYSLSIIRDKEISGEKGEFKSNSQITKPFVRQHFLEGVLPYDTKIIPGDVVKTVVNSEFFLAMNVTDVVLENTCIKKETVFYRCNVSGEVLRVSGEERNLQTYALQPIYQSISNLCYAVIADTDAGTDILQEERIGQIETNKLFLFIPHSVGIRPLDIYIPYSGEYYKVESVEKFRFPAVDYCILSENTID